MIKYDALSTLIKKLLSPEYIIILRDRVIAFNEHRSVLSEIAIDSNSFLVADGYNEIDFPVVIYIEELKAYVKELDDALKGSSIGYNINIIDEQIFGYSINKYTVYSDIMSKYMMITGREQCNPLVMKRDIRNDEVILNMLANPSNAGSYVLIYDNKYYISIYKSLLNITKADGLELEIYDDINDPLTFNVKFIIHKKKEKFDIVLHMIYLKV